MGVAKRGPKEEICPGAQLNHNPSVAVSFLSLLQSFILKHSIRQILSTCSKYINMRHSGSLLLKTFFFLI